MSGPAFRSYSTTDALGATAPTFRAGLLPHITPDVLTGIGAWSDDELALGIAKAKTNSESDVRAHAAYPGPTKGGGCHCLSSLNPREVNPITSVCPVTAAESTQRRSRYCSPRFHGSTRCQTRLVRYAQERSQLGLMLPAVVTSSSPRLGTAGSGRTDQQQRENRRAGENACNSGAGASGIAEERRAKIARWRRRKPSSGSAGSQRDSSGAGSMAQRLRRRRRCTGAPALRARQTVVWWLHFRSGTAGSAAAGMAGTGGARGRQRGRGRERGRGRSRRESGAAGMSGDAALVDSPCGRQRRCGQERAAGAGGSSGTLPCAVRAVLQTRCQLCHSSPPKAGAPFPLLTWVHVNGVAGAIQTVLEQGLMPPSGAPPATQAEVATLLAYVEAGAPSAGAITCPCKDEFYVRVSRARSSRLSNVLQPFTSRSGAGNLMRSPR